MAQFLAMSSFVEIVNIAYEINVVTLVKSDKIWRDMNVVDTLIQIQKWWISVLHVYFCRNNKY